MFGIFKSKRKSADEEFGASLFLFASFFSERVEFLNSQQSKELVATVFAVYLQRNPDEAGQTVCEFYLNSLVGNICEAINQGILDTHTGLLMWRQTSKFLLAHPDFNDSLVKICMNNWKSLLIQNGVDTMNFDTGFYAA